MFKSKQEISIEKLKSTITNKLNHSAAEATRKLVEAENSITDLSQAIEAATDKMYEAEMNLQRGQAHTKPDKKVLDAISASILEIQTLDGTIKAWKTRLEALQKERDGLLHGVKLEVEQIFGAVRAELQKQVDAEAATLMAFLISVENALEECRPVDNYVPCLKGVSAVVPGFAYLSHCKPKELVRYLHKKAPWWVCS
ncbi:MAG: hypothetical protein JJE30_06040 [Desulfuromonadales bacterium]|nr:hypothetical protein [Desulfuromonadales bacterium]